MQTEEEKKAAADKQAKLDAQKAQIEKEKTEKAAKEAKELEEKRKKEDEEAKKAFTEKETDSVVLECTFANGMYPKAFAAAGIKKTLRFRNHRASCLKSELKYLKANKQWNKEYGLSGEFKVRKNPSVEVVRK